MSDLNNPIELPGTVKAWGGSTPPAGWLFCDGSAISRTLYGALFAVIGETYGAGDGSTTFNLPHVGGFCETIPVIGDGVAIGITDKIYYAGLASASSGGNYAVVQRTDMYGKAAGTAVSSATSQISAKAIGLTTDSTKSGMIADLTAITLASAQAKAIIKY